MHPVIGIAVCGFTEEKQFVSHPYVHAVEQSGGLPILLPCTDPETARRLTDLCEGFLFCGGGDVTPLLMDEDPSPKSGSSDLKTDLFHLALMKEALASGKPILGICRGMQVLNIAMGGSIYQDASLFPSPSICHMQRSQKRSDPSHKVCFETDSMLFKIFGKSTDTNSFHHQYIKTPAKHLRPSARTSDQVIEALESDLHPFVIGVQWHPECMYDDRADMRQLFFLLIRASCNS